MNILFPLDLFYPSKVGGPANTLYWLGKALVRKGHKVTVVTSYKGIDPGRVNTDTWCKVDGIDVRYCTVKNKMPISVIYHSVKRLLKNDAVVFSSICYLPNYVIALVARFFGKVIIWSPRGELFDTAVQDNKGKKISFKLLNCLLGKKILFHATSEVEVETIKKYFPNSQTIVIPNYMEVPTKESVTSDYSDFIFVGRIAPIKAIDKLIDGLGKSSLFRSSRYKLRIVGGVEKQFETYFNGLNKQVAQLGLQDKIIFVGSLTGKDKFQAYATARYMFLVSNSENFGNVIIEALSQGTPVVASTGTPWASLLENKSGFWISNTPETIADTVDMIIEQDEREYSSYRVNAYNHSLTFDIYEHVDDWIKVLKMRRQTNYEIDIAK